MGVNYPILIGNKSVEKSYGGLSLLPTTFFLDRDGKIVTHEFGLRSRSDFVNDIKRALIQDHAVQERK